MPRTRNPYPTDFRDQIVALVRTGRSVESLAREFEPCAATIHERVRQALDMSRFRTAPSARLGHFSFESDGAFPAQC